MIEICYLIKPTKFKVHIFSTISFVLIVFLILFVDNIISNLSLQLHTHKLHQPMDSKTLFSVKEDVNILPPLNLAPEERVLWFKQNIPEFHMLFETTTLVDNFDNKVKEFLGRNCSVQIFNTWISPVWKFGKREFFSLQSVFKAHPNGCLVIVSMTMDSIQGQTLLQPLVDKGFKVIAIRPNLSFLFNNTPAESWLNDIKTGKKDPGRIPFAQNLSNLIRLAVLYKYGGVYLDSDFIILKDFSGLKNSIGAQSADLKGNWLRLNNAVLIFDKNHPLVYKFIEEFAESFDGNRWGHNGPYLVSRVVERVGLTQDFNFTILPPIAFYPVDWRQINGFFASPKNVSELRWMKLKMIQINRESFGVHLWNRESKRLVIEEGSILNRLIYDHCSM
ncbi:hypothetical protein Leryth_000067 [Lithospermum erythrorhizon]|nr:hypothetical protein Leryth_000067 [Lithospermum erythrorhizon]